MTISSKIFTAKLSLAFREQDVYCFLKQPWRILQSEQHASKREKAVMGWEGCFITIIFGSSDLPISIIIVSYRKYRRITKKIEPFVHAWYCVQIPDHHCVQFAVVGAKAKSSVNLKD